MNEHPTADFARLLPVSDQMAGRKGGPDNGVKLMKSVKKSLHLPASTCQVRFRVVHHVCLILEDSNLCESLT